MVSQQPTLSIILKKIVVQKAGLMDDLTLIRTRIEESIQTKTLIINDLALITIISKLADAIVETLNVNGKLLLCGNGGSASDALHIAGELVGRFQKERQAWPAVVLNADVATMTSIANDYGYDEVFARQIDAHMKKEDILLGISTSGNSSNIIRAFIQARERGGKTALLSGKGGGALKDLADFPIIVPSDVTARIQESHICIAHIICELVENRLSVDHE
jgi:D-sedoheptulose 7-phosphate isomerase